MSVSLSNGISGMTDNEPTVVSFDLPGTYTVKLDGRKEHLTHRV